MHTFKVYKLISFHVCIHLWNHSDNQDNDLKALWSKKELNRGKEKISSRLQIYKIKTGSRKKKKGF